MSNKKLGKKKSKTLESIADKSVVNAAHKSPISKENRDLTGNIVKSITGKTVKNIESSANKVGDAMKDVLESNVLNSRLVKDIKEGVEEFANSAKKTFDFAIKNQPGSADLSKKLIRNLTDNINNSFKHNLNLSHESLKCRNATDFIDIQRKFFENNYQGSVRIYTDFIHDIQQIINNSMNQTKNTYIGK